MAPLSFTVTTASADDPTSETRETLTGVEVALRWPAFAGLVESLADDHAAGYAITFDMMLVVDTTSIHLSLTNY